MHYGFYFQIALTTESEVLAPENLLGTMSSEITTEAPQVSTEMWFGKGDHSCYDF